MTLDPNVDRALAELWAISDAWREHVVGGLEAMRSYARGWEPRPMPENWGRDAQLKRRV